MRTGLQTCEVSAAAATARWGFGGSGGHYVQNVQNRVLDVLDVANGKANVQNVHNPLGYGRWTFGRWRGGLGAQNPENHFGRCFGGLSHA